MLASSCHHPMTVVFAERLDENYIMTAVGSKITAITDGTAKMTPLSSSKKTPNNKPRTI
jgi:hypothetical protein